MIRSHLSLFCTSVTVLLTSACCQQSANVSNRSTVKLWIPNSHGTKSETELDVPAELRIKSATCIVTEKKAEVAIEFNGGLTPQTGATTVEAYFDDPSDRAIQSLVVVWTLNYKFGSLDGSGTAAVYHRELINGNELWKRVSNCSVIWSGSGMRLSANLESTNIKPNMIILRNAPNSIITKSPPFRFSNDGIAATVTFGGNRTQSRPLPGLPDDANVQN